MKIKKYILRINKPKKVLGVTWNNKTDTLIYDFFAKIRHSFW